MNLSRPLLATIGLVSIAIICALVVAPARWIMVAVPANWPLTVIDARGTLWSGSATLAVGTASHRRVLPDAVQWRWTLTPMPSLQVTHAWLGGAVDISPHWGGISVSGQSLQVPASIFSTLDARIAAIAPGGNVIAKWPALTIDPRGAVASARPAEVEWRQASSALSTVRPLGSYSLAVISDGQAATRLQLNTLQGPLSLQGTGSVNRAGVRFDGTAQVAPDQPADIQARLGELLAALGPRKNDQTLISIR